MDDNFDIVDYSLDLDYADDGKFLDTVFNSTSLFANVGLIASVVIGKLLLIAVVALIFVICTGDDDGGNYSSGSYSSYRRSYHDHDQSGELNIFFGEAYYFNSISDRLI